MPGQFWMQTSDSSACHKKRRIRSTPRYPVFGKLHWRRGSFATTPSLSWHRFFFCAKVTGIVQSTIRQMANPWPSFCQLQEENQNGLHFSKRRALITISHSTRGGNVGVPIHNCVRGCGEAGGRWPTRRPHCFSFSSFGHPVYPLRNPGMTSKCGATGTA